MIYYGYNQLYDPDTAAAAFRRDREHQKLVNQFTPKDCLGRPIRAKLTKKEQRRENVVAAIMYLLIIPFLFVLPALVFFAIIGL